MLSECGEAHTRTHARTHAHTRDLIGVPFNLHTTHVCVRALLSWLGRYQYRLCKAGSTLDEDCFAKTPLQFAVVNGVYKHTVIGKNSSNDHQITGTVVSEGGGIGWALNPFGYQSNAPCDWNPAAYVTT